MASDEALGEVQPHPGRDAPRSSEAPISTDSTTDTGVESDCRTTKIPRIQVSIAALGDEDPEEVELFKKALAKAEHQAKTPPLETQIAHAVQFIEMAKKRVAGADYDYATCNLLFSLTSIFPVFNSGHLSGPLWIGHHVFWYSHDYVWVVNRSVSALPLGLSTCPWVISAENSCFVIFNVTRAILETLLCHMRLVALWSQRAAVKSRHTQQRFVLWLRRLHELANPWKWFKCLVMFWINVWRSFEVIFPLLCCLVFRLCEVPRLCERRCWSGFREKHCCTIEKCSEVLCNSFNPCFQPARVILNCFFPLSRGWGLLHLFVHASHMMSHRTWLRALDLVFATWFCESKHVSSWLISAISREHHECHPADRYIHSGNGAARSAALFCWSLRDAFSLTAERNFWAKLIVAGATAASELAPHWRRSMTAEAGSGDRRHTPTWNGNAA